MKLLISAGLLSILLLPGCSLFGTKDPDVDLSPEIKELNTYKNEASKRCAGTSYRDALGQSGGASLKAIASVSENLLSKGYGTGSADIGVTLQEKSELAVLLGGLSNEYVDRFLGRYQPCMNEDMSDFYRVKGKVYPSTPEARLVWATEVHTARETAIAYRTERSGNWRHYEVCVSIPPNALMLKETVSSKVIAGVGAGPWGDWAKDFKFVDNNAYGPTKVCRGFDHQIHDQNRTLELTVQYKRPKS